MTIHSEFKPNLSPYDKCLNWEVLVEPIGDLYNRNPYTGKS